MINYETILPSPGGFLYAADIKTGDYLYDKEGQPTEVLYTETVDDCIQHKIELRKEGVIFVTPDQQIKIHQASRIPTNIENWRSYWRIDKCRALNPQPLEVVVDPYVFGLWFWDYNSNHRESVTLPVLDSHLPTAVKHLNHAGITVTGKTSRTVKRGKVKLYRLSTDISVWSKLASDFYKKPTIIPDNYMYGSLSQRRALVSSFFACNRRSWGYDSKTHVYLWVKFGSNEKLTMQMMELCHSIGYGVERVTHNGDAAFLIKNKKRSKQSHVKNIEQIDNEPAVHIETRAGSYLISEDNIICLN